MAYSGSFWMASDGNLGIYFVGAYQEFLPTVARIWLSHDDSQMDMGRPWLWLCTSNGGILHPPDCNVYFELRARGLGTARTHPRTSRTDESYCIGSEQLRYLDLPNAHFLELNRNASGAMVYRPHATHP